MKKFLFIAAALLALAACSKVVPVETPDQEISFQVANYATSTKANASILDEGITSFTTTAFYHPGDNSAVQTFMDGEIITADPANSTNATVKKWKPTSHPYYWPKTGYINFFSYAGFTGTAASGQTAANPAITETTFKLTGYVVNTPQASNNTLADNLLVAKPAMNYAANSTMVDHGVEANVAAGVPILFYHMLAKIQFKVVLDASGTDRDEDDDTRWTAYIPNNLNLITIYKKGDLNLTYNVGSSTAARNVEFVAESATSKWWSVSAETADQIGITPLPAGTATYPTDATVNSVAVTTTEGKKGDEVVLLAEYVVIPQSADIPFNFTYTLVNEYKDGNTYKEVFNDPNIALPTTITKLTDFTSTSDITRWEANHIYTYTITIKPNGPIVLNPAVTEWVEVTDPAIEL